MHSEKFDEDTVAAIWARWFGGDEQLFTRAAIGKMTTALQRLQRDLSLDP
jgi:hypothetical protein